MFFFFGISPKTIRHGFVMHDCRVHGGSSWHELVTQRSYFTLFFLVRVFPVGGRHDLLTCTTCGVTWQLPPAEAMRLQGQARTDTGPTSGGMGGMRRGDPYSAACWGTCCGNGRRRRPQQPAAPRARRRAPQVRRPRGPESLDACALNASMCRAAPSRRCSGAPTAEGRHLSHEARQAVLDGLGTGLRRVTFST